MNPIGCYVGCDAQRPRLSPGPSVVTHPIVHHSLAYTGFGLVGFLVVGVVLCWVGLVVSRVGRR